MAKSTTNRKSAPAQITSPKEKAISPHPTGRKPAASTKKTSTKQAHKETELNGKTTTKATELTKETTIESSEDSDNELSEVHFEMKDSSDEETVSDTEMISMKREKGETVDRIKAQMLHYFGGKHNYERWVFKCTSKVPEPPHINYLRKIILEAWECKSINFFYKELIKYILNGFCD